MSVAINAITIRCKAICYIDEAGYEDRIATDPANNGLARDKFQHKSSPHTTLTYTSNIMIIHIIS